MPLVIYGDGVVEIRGTFAGQHFKRDRSGNHFCSMQRRVHSRSSAQAKQRKAFSKARAHTKDPRWVSWYIYQALNDLPFVFDAIVTGDPDPDCTGRYIIIGKYNEKDLYQRTDGTWYIFYETESSKWYIGFEEREVFYGMWIGDTTIKGRYEGLKPVYKQAYVTLRVQPPPADYQIPHLQAPKK
ncbi:hypothetical protein ES703_13514 [subsurface metagenome]